MKENLLKTPSTTDYAKIGLETVKVVGAIAWIVGLLTWNLFILGVALLATAYSVRKTRERRHRELIEAARQ